MRLTHLSLTNFRNFARLDIEVPHGPILLVGGNAQGKTSLLEAVYFTAAFTSFHATSDRQLINFLAAREPLAVARIVMDYCLENRPDKSGVHRMEIRIIQEGNGGNGGSRVRKEILLDGVKKKVSEAIGSFNAVLFLPQMLRIVEGAPEERRRYLNLAMEQVIPNYADLLDAYQHALTQRNALLKLLSERGGDTQQLNYWDEQLAISGAQIIYSRIHAILEIERFATSVHRELTRGQEVLRLVYQPAYDPFPQRPIQYALPIEAPINRSALGLEKIRNGLLDCLNQLRKDEIARGVTTTGPHRDELRFLGNGIDLGIFGSRGQARTAVLSLKLAEVAWMKEKTGFWPVLLLDEVLAELDTLRRQDLLTRLSQCEQALLTTTDLDLFSPDFVEAARLWHIQAGQLIHRASLLD
jgi:DNA replication and repair protein RecF